MKGAHNSHVVQNVTAYADNHVLELTADDQPAFALIRYYGNGRGYRIVDATAPIPTTQAYSEGVSEPYPLINATSSYLKAWNKIKGGSYSIQRKPAINFPSIFPYRTDLTFEETWTADRLTLTPGVEDTMVSSIGYRSNAERKLDGFGAEPKSPASKNSQVRPGGLGYSNKHRVPALDYNWWNTKYSKNIPSQMAY